MYSCQVRLDSKDNGDGKVSYEWEDGGCKASDREGIEKKEIHVRDHDISK